MRYAIVDIETTGNGLKGNKITEIAIFVYDGTAIVDEFASLVHPQCSITPFITALTGIDDDTVRDAPPFSEIALKVLEITQDCVFVAHAVNFDYGVIKEEFRQLGMDFVRKKLCTVRLSRKLVPGLRSYSLGKLCTALEIPLTDRHRAEGDARATVTLFRYLMQQPNAELLLGKFLNSRSQEATLPPHLDRREVEALPNAPGVYYFLDQNKKIIYVGKAKSLKKRVLGHFYDKSEHEIQLCRNVAHIDFDLSGSELLALLMESAAIKRHVPQFNRAQKRHLRQYALFSYEDRRGILHLGMAALRQVAHPLVVFSSKTECITLLRQLCLDFLLCPKYAQIVPVRGTSQSCQSPHCQGICEGRENMVDYNLRVREAIASISVPTNDGVLKLKGRQSGEDAFVFMENGRYIGYGFVTTEISVNTLEDLRPFLIPQKNTVETQRLVENAIQNSGNLLLLGENS